MYDSLAFGSLLHDVAALGDSSSVSAAVAAVVAAVAGVCESGPLSDCAMMCWLATGSVTVMVVITATSGAV